MPGITFNTVLGTTEVAVNIPPFTSRDHYPKLKVTITTRELGNPDKPQYYKPSEVIAFECSVDDMMILVKNLHTLLG